MRGRVGAERGGSRKFRGQTVAEGVEQVAAATWATGAGTLNVSKRLATAPQSYLPMKATGVCRVGNDATTPTRLTTLTYQVY